jgi:hypothetical protein
MEGMNAKSLTPFGKEVIELDESDELAARLVFVNPFLAAENAQDEAGSQDRVVEAQSGFGNYLEAKLGVEARKMFEQITNAIVVEIGEREYFIEGKNLTDKEFRMRELSDAWRDLGCIVEWLKAQGIPLRHPDCIVPESL